MTTGEAAERGDEDRQRECMDQADDREVRVTEADLGVRRGGTTDEEDQEQRSDELGDVRGRPARGHGRLSGQGGIASRRSHSEAILTTRRAERRQRAFRHTRATGRGCA